MANNWKKAVERINRDKYSVPPGWDTKETVALQLGCSPDRVNETIKPGLDSGDFERKDFMIWDERRGTTVKTACYRIVDRSAKEPADQLTPQEKREALKQYNADSLQCRVATSILKHPDWTDLRIAKSFKGVNVGYVQAIRANV